MFQNLLSRSSSQPFTRAVFTTILLGLLTVAGFGQTPRVYLKFDGDLTDSSTHSPAIITSVTAAGTGYPSYTTDRFGVAGKALNLPGAGSLKLNAAALAGNSNQALGLRNAGGTNTSFTLAAWVKFTSVSLQWYNTIFGNLGTGTGTLHTGTGINVAVAHFGFDSNDVNATITQIVAGKWYHMAFVYNAADTTQRIYINGVPEVVRTGVTDTIKIADLLLGNWNTTTDASNDMKGALDDVVVYNVALSAGKIQALYNNVNPVALPATYSGPKLPGTAGGIDFWGIREIKAYPGILYTNLVNVDQIINTYAVTPGGTVANYTAPVVNFADPQSIGNLGAFANEANFGIDTGSDDDNFLLIAKGAVRIAVEDDYTFGFIGDEGSRLRVLNQTFISSSSANNSATNPVAPAHNGDGIYWENNTLNSGTLGVVHLVPGDYNLEFVYWENTGTSACDVFAARGAKTVIDSTFQLVGNTAAGGLPLVRDPDSLPQVTSFTANGGSSLFVLAGAPATFTLAWQTNAVPTSVSIDQGIGAVGQSGSMVLASPTVTTTYTITATAGADTTTKTLTVYVDAVPNITTFTASKTKVLANTAVTLSWTVDGASTLTLNPGGIDVTGQTSKVVNPATTTTYTLVATNVSGSSQQSVTITVGVAPVISSFVVTDPSPLYGAETSLSWNVPAATNISINQGIGAVPVPSGSVSIVPLQTTTYTLTAVNDYGTTTANASITVATPIGVNITGFTARRVFATAATPLPFANQSYLESALSLLGTGPNTGQNELNEATQAGFQTLNFADGVDGDFTSANNPYPGSGSTNYAVQITGTLVVNTPGQYTFVVNSSYGCRLRIDGQDVIVDDSSHSPGDSTGSINLSKPTVSVEVIAYGVSGSSEVELAWIRPNLSW